MANPGEPDAGVGAGNPAGLAAGPSKDRLSLADFDAGRLPSWAQRPARRIHGFVVRHQDHVVVAMFQRFSAISGTDRALSIGAHAFVAFVPLVLLLTSKFTVNGDSVIAHRIIVGYHLSGRAAAATRALFDTPTGTSKQGWIAFILSILVAVVSALALTAAMQRTFAAAWGLKPLGVKGRIFGIGGIAAILVEVLLLSLIGTVVKGAAGGVFHLVVRLLVATAFWLVISWLLLGRRISWRQLVPGAVVSGVGSVVAHFASGVYMPRVIATNASRYGAVGITFAIMTWLYVLGLVLVIGAVVGAQLGGARLVRRSDQTSTDT
jgi:membrane protein